MEAIIKLLTEKNVLLKDNPSYIRSVVIRVIQYFRKFIRGEVGNNVEMISLMVSLYAEWQEEIEFDWSDFNECLKEANSQLTNESRGRIITVDNFKEKIFDFYKESYDTGIKIKQWPVFQEHFKIAKREVTVITGIPSHGKSEFADAMMINLAKDYNWKFALFSPENYPYEMHFDKLSSKLIGKPFHTGKTDRLSTQELNDSIAWIFEYFYFIEPHESNVSLEAILELAKKAIKLYKIDCLLIDPWNEIEHASGNMRSETDYIGESLIKIKKFARLNNIAIWIIAHPQKLYRDKDGNRNVPTPYDIHGSANWYNKPENCLTVFRNSDDSTSIHIQKVRFKIRGHTGKVDFNYDKITGIYTEAQNGF